MTLSHAYLFSGVLVGLSVAVPIGPMGLLCIQRTLAFGMRIGVCTGLGAATVNVLYGLLITLDFSRVAPLAVDGGRVKNLVAGMILLRSAAQAFMRKQQRPSRVQGKDVLLSPIAAYGSALGFSVTNPAAPLSILALLSPVVGTGALAWSETAGLLIGMFLAAMSWWVCLSAGISMARARLGAGVLRTINRIAGAVLTLYGAAALARA